MAFAEVGGEAEVDLRALAEDDLLDIGGDLAGDGRHVRTPTVAAFLRHVR